MPPPLVSEATAPQRTQRETEHFECALFHFLYLLAPRVSEVASHSMNSFREFREKWRWFVERNGGKRAKIPVNDEMLDALMPYRRFLGLDDLPAEDDVSPIIRSIKGDKGVSANMVYRLVKDTADAAAEKIEAKAPINARKLGKASCHWFRLTAVTHGDDSGIGIKYIQAPARHEKLETAAISEDHR